MRHKLYIRYVPRLRDTRVYRTFVFYKRLGDEVRILEMANIRERLQRHRGHSGASWNEWVDYEWAD